MGRFLSSLFEHGITQVIFWLFPVYRKTGTQDPSGTLAGPYQNRKTGTQDHNGTLAGRMNTRKLGPRDPSGILAGALQKTENWNVG